MTAPSTTTLRPPAAGLVARALAAGRDQAVVAAGQLAAGAGNLLFIAVAARVLPRSGFGDLAAFVALLTALHLPGAGLAAAGALTGGDARRLARRVSAVAGVAGLLLAVLASPVSQVVGLPIPFVLALAAALPPAGLLGLRRGLAYRAADHRGLVRSLLAEPGVRLGVGLALGAAFGPAGAAWGVAAGGWVALVSLGAPPARRVLLEAPTARATGAVGVAFVGLALLQHVDLIVANRTLSEGDAANVAALSILGGVVAFATATLPLVLMPQAERGEPHALRVALTAAGAVALGATTLAVLAGPDLVTAAVGPGYADVAPLVPPYLAAMGALGIARVLAAGRCADGEGRRVAQVVVVVVAAHVVALATFARTPGQVVGVSGVALVSVATGLALPSAWDRPSLPQRAWDRVQQARRAPDARLLIGVTLVALLVRLATNRSFWIDEAVTITQAQLPFGAMLADLQATDVHPPLHSALVWVVVHLLGTDEWVARLPSVLCGTALVPVLYAVARRLFDRRTARVAALLAVPAPFLVWYSQEARMYALFMLAGVLAVWAQQVALTDGGRAAFVAWGVASAAMVWTQWFAVLPLAVQQVATVVHLWRHRGQPRAALARRRWGLSLAVTLGLLAPLLPFLSAQLAAYGERGAGLAMPSAAGADSSSVAGGLSAYAVLANLLWALGGYHGDDVMVRLGSLWPLALLGCLLLLGRRLASSSRLLLAVALLPGAALFLIGHTKRDLFELRYFILAVPLLLLLVARTTTVLARSRTGLAVGASALVALSSVALIDQQVNGTNPRLYDFAGATEEITETATPGDTLVYAPSYLDGVLGYYSPELDSVSLDALELGAAAPDVDGGVSVLVAERLLTPAGAKQVGDVLARLERERGAPERFERPNIVVWRFA